MEASEAIQADHQVFREEMSGKLEASEKKCEQMKSENAALKLTLEEWQNELEIELASIREKLKDLLMQIWKNKNCKFV